MVALTCLVIILHFSVISEGIEIRNSFSNSGDQTTKRSIVLDLNEGESVANSTQNGQKNVSASDYHNGDTVSNNIEDSNMTFTDMSETRMATNNIVNIHMNKTFENITYRQGMEFELPLEWMEFCYIGAGKEYSSEFTQPVNLTEIICDITPEYSGIWTMTDLRHHLALYDLLNLKYSVDIRCQSSSNISISWPVKVAHLYMMNVKHCIIADFLAEFNEKLIQTTPDSLRVLNLSDNKVLVATDVYIDTLKNVKNIQSEYNCGQDETLETWSMRNLSYGFIDSVELYRKLTDLGEQFILDAKRIPFKCDYKHLMFLDEGQTTSMSVYHSELKDSIFYELRVYNLSHSYIKSLKDQQLQWSVTYPKLETYDLSYNHISRLARFEIPLHTRMDRVTTINLQHNRITSISVEDLERYKMMPMMFIDLRNNPIHCNCTENMKNLLTYIREKKYLNISNLSDYSYIKDLRCVEPDRLQSRTLESITDMEDLCVSNVEKEYFVVPIMVLSGTIVALSIILFALLRYRKEVLIILFTRFNIIIPCHQRHSNDLSKKYDAFVSYSSKEEEWVESMFENLELQLIDGKRRFRFCLHHRDFIPGRTIFDNVINSVENSRHTIILLSNTFLQSEFCLYEFQEAFRQSIMEQKRHLVIVMMEELDADKLPRDLRRCIQTFTYIRKDDYLFRERLIYALSVKQKSKIVEQKSRKVKYATSKTDASITNISKQNKKLTEKKISGADNNSQSNTNRTALTSSDNSLSVNPNKQTVEHNNSHTVDVYIEKSGNNVGNNIPNEALSDEAGERLGKLHTSKRNLVDSIKTEKGLVLNIDNDTRVPLYELECNACVADIDIVKSEGVNKVIDVDNTTRISDYDRSMSVLSHDTGYFSEKGSPDICSPQCDSFDKNIFSDNMDITDFVV